MVDLNLPRSGLVQQTEQISEEWAREDLGNQIQAAVAEALSKSMGAPS